MISQTEMPNAVRKHLRQIARCRGQRAVLKHFDCKLAARILVAFGKHTAIPQYVDAAEMFSRIASVNHRVIAVLLDTYTNILVAEYQETNDGSIID